MKTFLSILILICSLTTKAQPDSLIDIYDLGHKMKTGDKEALLKLSEHFSDTLQATDYMEDDPYIATDNPIFTTKGYIALRIFKEDVFFLPTEVNLSDTDLVQLAKRIHQLKNKIYFDTNIKAFLVTPLQQWKSKFTLRNASDYEMHRLNQDRDTLLNTYTNIPRFKKMLKEHDNRILSIIANRMIENHDPRSNYSFNATRYTNLFTLLTGISVGIPLSDSVTAFHLDNYYYSNYGYEIKFYYALYWLTHYKDYSWSDSMGRFKNNVAHVENSVDPYDLYLHMEDTDKRVAITAFEKLFTFDTKTIENLNLEFQTAGQNFPLDGPYWDYILPARKLHFYCIQNNFNDKDPTVINRIDFLGHDNLSYCARYTAENDLINTLTLDNISTVELWALEHAATLDDLNSVSRIIDKFYSRHWNELVNNQRYLKLYLKTANALWFRHAGSCGDYLGKFGESTAANTQLLTPLLQETTDDDIKNTISKLLSGDYWETVNSKKDEVLKFRSKEIENASLPWPENMRHAPVIANFEDTLRTLSKYDLTKDSVKETYLKVLALATYTQLGTALQYSLKIKTVGVDDEQDSLWYANCLVHEHFDIPLGMIASIDDLNIFLKNYYSLSELELYKFYLKRDCINIYTKKGKLDFQQIYDILKFDYSPFYFNKSYNRTEGIFAITKILEYHFHTTLGLPLKNQHSDGFNYISSFTLERRDKWMKYLLEHRLVSVPKYDTYAFIDCQY